jgi:ribosomal protein L7/L12
LSDRDQQKNDLRQGSDHRASKSLERQRNYSKNEKKTTLVHPIVMYGCETWTMRKRDRDKVNAFENWCWRRLLRIAWTAKRTNASIREQLGISTMMSEQIAERKLKYFGHVMRGDGLEKAVMMGMGGGKRERGRPKIRWLDEIKELTGLSLQELKEAVRDREKWRNIVRTVTRGRTRPDGTR